MKDLPEARDPQPDNQVDPGAARPSSGFTPYPEMYLYALLFASFTTGAAISIVVNEILTATGSPADIVRAILLDMWRAAAAGAVFAVTVAIVLKTVGAVSRYRRRLPFNPREEKPRR